MAADVSRRGMERHLGNQSNHRIKPPTDPTANQSFCDSMIANYILPKPKNKPIYLDASKNELRMLDLSLKTPGTKLFDKVAAIGVEVG